MIRARVAAVYPGKKTSGIALTTFDNHVLTNAAIGQIATSTVGPVMKKFGPDLVVIEPVRKSKLGAGDFTLPAGTKIHIAHPKWDQRNTKLPEWRTKLNALGLNAWKMLWDFTLRSDTLTVTRLRPVRYSRLWLTEHGKG